MFKNDQRIKKQYFKKTGKKSKNISEKYLV